MTDREYYTSIVEAFARAFRVVLRERGVDALDNAIVISSYDILGDKVAGVKHLYAPTIGRPVLANVRYAVANEFDHVLYFGDIE